ncbi:hypothetical protein SAMN05192575_102284 [Nocardioides alpinus]|uniref:Alkaline shock response membrane anchor protein AmaP n=1 Tax=Nocardioides alpinus TaxID=748909 RepID=A0A1I0XD03_9ACTN|nr:hypothetical protein [Nocardioides alpinus]PKH44250.1 hypothetical protein CXG46_01445 [Nocardioides alpinus]SFA98306.1 hypothetical protein SAMN05192575_102284 [Nocardioides alpinus]
MSTTRTERALARAPLARHRAVAIGIVLALGLVAVGVVAVRDLAVAEGWATGEPWLADGLRSLDGLGPTDGVLAVATLAALLGLLLMYAGLRPAARRHVASGEVEQLWSNPSALAEVARSAADRAPGVVSARTARARKGRVVIEVATREGRTTDGADPTDARDRATTAGQALGARRVDVRTAQEES